MARRSYAERERAVRARISQRLGRRAPPIEELDVDPSALPEAIRAVDTPPDDAERAEEEDLERNVSDLHALHSLGDADIRSPRRILAPAVTRARAATVTFLRPVFVRQSTFNGAVARSVSHLRNRSIRHEFLLRTAIGALTPALRNQAKALQTLERRLELLERRQTPSQAESLDELAFANRFRGPEPVIRERQQQYVDAFRGAEAPVLDFGCGRGEFLELLREAGVDGRGVDFDREMVEHCRAKGLAVELRDGLAYLGTLPPRSLGGIFASHVLEHLELQRVLTLVRHARRVLRPAAAIVLETHNPQTFATYPIYAIDPTHVRLYHPETVSWLLEQHGFVELAVTFTDPADGDESGHARPRAVDDERLASFLHGHLTYAVVGRAPQE